VENWIKRGADPAETAAVDANVRRTVERILEQGGEGADIMTTLQGDQPELAKEIAFVRPPDDPSAWAAAYDKAMA